MSSNRPIRILHVVGGMNRGGAETMIMNAFRHIDRTRFVFDFAVNTDQPCAFDDEIRSLGGRIFPHPKPAVTGGRGWLNAFENTIRGQGPFGAVHSHVHHFSGLSLRVARKMGVPVRIAHSHNTQDAKSDTIRRAVYRWSMRNAMRVNATHFLACSTAAGQSLFGENPRKPFRVVPNAIDLEPYKKLPVTREGRACLRKQLGLPVEGLLLGHIGRFSEQKNHTFLVDILEEAFALRPDGCAVLVGDGPLRPEIEAKVAALGIADRVHFLGIRDDIPHLLGAMDVFLFPSLFEGLPVVLVEAQAAGVPCLISSAITTDIDLHLGFIRFVSSASPSEHWAQLLSSVTPVTDQNYKLRINSIQSAGYDVRSSVALMEAIYDCCGV